MRILYLASLVDVPQDPNGGQGGIRHVLEVARHLHQLDHEIKVICGGRGRHADTKYVDEHGIEYFHLYRGSSRVPASIFGNANPKLANPVVKLARQTARKFLRYVDSLRDARRIRKFLKSFPADVIYERTTSYSTAGMKVASASGIPLVAEVNDLDQSPGVLAAASAIVTPEPSSLPANLRHKATKLPWGVSSSFFAAGEEMERSHSDSNIGRPVIILVGSFLQWHGANTLVEVATLLKSKLPQARYLLVGEGPALNVTKRMVSDAGLDQMFEFTGMVESKDVPTFLANSDIAVAPYSHLLGADAARAAIAVPMKVLESMAVGIPTVVSEAGNSAGTVEHGVTGWVHETDNAESLANLILEIVNNPDLTTNIAAAGSKKMSAKYTWDRHVREIETIFESVTRRS